MPTAGRPIKAGDFVYLQPDGTVAPLQVTAGETLFCGDVIYVDRRTLIAWKCRAGREANGYAARTIKMGEVVSFHTGTGAIG